MSWNYLIAVKSISFPASVSVPCNSGCHIFFWSLDVANPTGNLPYLTILKFSESLDKKGTNKPSFNPFPSSSHGSSSKLFDKNSSTENPSAVSSSTENPSTVSSSTKNSSTAVRNVLEARRRARESQLQKCLKKSKPNQNANPSTSTGCRLAQKKFIDRKKVSLKELGKPVRCP